MKVLHGLLKLIVFALLIAGCVYLFLNPVSAIYDDAIARVEGTPLEDNQNARQAAAVILGVLLLIMLLPLWIWPSRKDKNITFAGNHGEVTVDLEPVERTLESVIQRLHEVKRVHDVRIKPIGGKKDPKNKVQVIAYTTLIKDANADARRITERVNSFIQSHTRRILGIQDVEVRLNVRRWVMNMKTVKPEPLLLTGPDDEDLNKIPVDFHRQTASYMATPTPAYATDSVPASSTRGGTTTATAGAATAVSAAGISGAHVEPAPRHTAAEAYKPPTQHQYGTHERELDIPPAGVTTRTEPQTTTPPRSAVDELESRRNNSAAAASQADVVYGDPHHHDTAAEPDEALASTSHADVVYGNEDAAEPADSYRSFNSGNASSSPYAENAELRSPAASVYDADDSGHSTNARESSPFSRSAFLEDLNEESEADHTPDAGVDWSLENSDAEETEQQERRWQA
ncbi:MAG: hypothetical protein WD873_02370 [Candidatus Hydrogenedentales bacterium]